MQKALLVSFTEAAAAELRSRIQGTLTEVAVCLRRGGGYRNAALEHVVAAAPGTSTEKVARLTAAQASIDQLTIGTIHSFCKQLLNKYPSECNARTGLVIASDLSETGAEATADAFAALVAAYPVPGPWENGFAGANRIVKQPTPDRLAKLAQGVIQSDLPIYPAHASLLTPAGSPTTDYADVLTWFALEVRTRMRARHKALGLITLSDLIGIVDLALACNPSPLAAKLKGTWDLIILDEAQDTDAAQWRILQTIAGSAGEFFAVGDPKQSIFSFRGAHYASLPPLQPGSPWTRGEALTTNYRSDAPLLKSLNQLYGNGAIEHFTAPNAHHDCRLHSGPGTQANRRSGLYFHTAAPPETGSYELSHTWAALAEAILQELEEGLLVEGNRGEQRAFGPGDIAVLVRYNESAEQIREALIHRGIPVAAASRDSILESDELRDLAALFAAIDAPYKDSAVNAAALTRIVGFDNPRLNQMIRDGDQSTGRQELVARLADLREKLAVESLGVVLEEIFDRPWPPSGLSARERILKEPDGERFMKNYLDIAAILVKNFWRCPGAATSPTSITSWLLKASARAAAREIGSEEDDGFSISLETDADAVRIMTVHAAKGRQFGSVWLPEACLSFSGSGNRYRDTGRPWKMEHGGEIVLEPAANPALAKPQAILDGVHEELRLLYVAGTRARYRTHLIVGCFDTPRNEPRLPLGHLLQATPPQDLNTAPPPFLEGGREAALTTRLQEFQQAAQAVGGVVEILPLPNAGVNRFAHASLSPPGNPTHPLQVPEKMWLSSFSSLAKWATTGTAAEDTDGDSLAVAEDEAAPAIAKPTDEMDDASVPDIPQPAPLGGSTPLTIPREVLPGGKQWGDFIHDVLEFMLPIAEPFQEADVSLILNRMAVAKGLSRATGITAVPAFGQHLAGPLLAALQQPLQGSAFGALSLCDLAHHGRVTTELPFTLSLDLTSTKHYENLLKVFLDHGSDDFAGFADAIPGLKGVDVRGLFTGLIDLVWQSQGERPTVALIDYKTNVFPRDSQPCLEAYSRDRLAIEMASSRYLLQAAVYAAVVDAWMLSRDPAWDYDQQFGGVAFTFLRAMGRQFTTQQDNAVFHVKVPKALARELSKTLQVLVRT